MASKTFKGGILLKHNKNTAEFETNIMPIPKKICIPMVHHIGAPCKLCVKKGDYVKVGQLIGECSSFVCSPVHSSVSGNIVKIVDLTYPNGSSVKAVEIETDGKQEIDSEISPPVVNNKEEFLKAIQKSGLVGLGGAGFPVHIKLSPPADKKIEFLIINAAECEPYITTDYRETVENTWNIISGINIVMEYLKIEKVLIGVEDNKPKTLKILTDVAKSNDKIDVVKLKSKYPQGAEKMLIYALTGRKVPIGKLPSEVGAIVMNVTSISFVAEYLKTGMPLVNKRITVEGSAIKNPKNILVPIGTYIKDAIEYTGGYKTEAVKILMGGPMMGLAQYKIDTPILKQNNAILAMSKKEVEMDKETNCIRCGRCVEACPMNLMPLAFLLHVEYKNVEELERYNIMNCMECGCCSYVCPAKKKLVQSIKTGKLMVKNSTPKGGQK